MAEQHDPATRATDLTSDQGKTTIADAVVAKIAGLAAREIPGVHELVPQSVGQTITGLAQRVAGTDTRTRGVSVDVGEQEAHVVLRLVADYGVSIPQVAEAVRRNVIERIRAMTGLMVTVVNIDVTDLFFPDEQPHEAAAAAAS